MPMVSMESHTVGLKIICINILNMLKFIDDAKSNYESRLYIRPLLFLVFFAHREIAAIYYTLLESVDLNNV